jgi:hypothetical protein
LFSAAFQPESQLSAVNKPKLILFFSFVYLYWYFLF